MARFINSSRLDYLCLNDVFIRKEFIRLKKLNEYYNHRTAEFLIKNNFCKHLLRHKNICLAVFRIHFCDIWEWHIREEIIKIAENIEKQYFGDSSKMPDCIWMLKMENTGHLPCYYCDIAFFWHHKTVDKCWIRKLNDLPETSPYVSKIEVLIQSSDPDTDRKFLLKLCQPEKYSTLLQCEFSNHIEMVAQVI